MTWSLKPLHLNQWLSRMQALLLFCSWPSFSLVPSFQVVRIFSVWRGLHSNSQWAKAVRDGHITTENRSQQLDLRPRVYAIVRAENISGSALCKSATPIGASLKTWLHHLLSVIPSRHKLRPRCTLQRQVSRPSTHLPKRFSPICWPGPWILEAQKLQSAQC